ncbi:MAG: HypC/HybG/HupF family hydrogenase formation chaperone [Deltaproteobacteria bacterium]|nr:HypC/HybG/HupF family hydrogenase formation chaperone [Deltaproteobacteria bacterium]MBW1952970.1 HypC/HybG/HupF family hydrogenase formation chaperone [Deltaproteobacteria bacterium]MBW1987759.1 HypC/HybG/HupF family hydrogenase formation chaperone [Deltaproteobacteria bacterium]MBW2135725.1 HypC/HybG/HupF family hydrogenase formation chaperone [Deltaproteobacteria bacterium]
MCLAIPGEILSIQGEEPLSRTARVSFGGLVKEVSLACVPQAQVGNYVLVHVGFAINILDASAAQQTWELLRQLDRPSK